MSNARTLPRTAFETARAYGSLDEVLYLSLLGPEVWALYRQGGHPALLIDLHQPGINPNMFATWVTTTVVAAAASERFGSLDAVGKFIEASAGNLRRKHRIRWEYQHHFPWLFLAHLDEVRLGAARLDGVRKLISVMVNSVYNGVRADHKYRSRLKVVWFEICDAALTVDTGAGMR